MSLKLDSVETVSHNVKKFRFALPESGMESGLSVACASLFSSQSPPCPPAARVCFSTEGEEACCADADADDGVMQPL